jgi:hypothetical protein
MAHVEAEYICSGKKQIGDPFVGVGCRAECANDFCLAHFLHQHDWLKLGKMFENLFVGKFSFARFRVVSQTIGLTSMWHFVMPASA